MLACLPLLAWVLILRGVRRSGKTLRAAILISSILWAAGLVAITEIASLFQAVNRAGLSAGWITVCVTAILAGARWRTNAERQSPSIFVDGWVRFLAGAIAMEMLALLAIALIAPPNTWDAMTYHMSRVMHWMQNGSVAHYPTHILRQIHLNPGAEFIILNLQVLSGGDRLANLPQWMAMVGSVIAVTLIARRCGAGPLGQIVAAATCVSIPMGVLQATGTQNDYVAAFWLVSATWLLFEMRSGEAAIRNDLLFGLALALALLTKATAFIYGLPLVVWFAIQKRGPRAARGLAIVGLLAIALNVGHWSRNYRVFGHILGPRDEVSTYRNASFLPQLVLSNALRNLSLHANLGSENFCQLMTQAVELVHEAVGMDVHDPRSTLAGTNYWVPDRWSHEDEAGCGFHLLLILLAMVACLRLPTHSNNSIKPLIWIGLGGFLLFCAYLRFQPWNSRLHLPLLVLMCPLIGVAVNHLPDSRVGAILGVVLAAYAVPVMLCNVTRPLAGETSLLSISREEAMFLGRPVARVPYEVEVQRLHSRGCRRLGLVLNPDSWEYPLWAMLNGGRAGPYLIDQVEVRNASANLPGGEHLDPVNPSCGIKIKVEP